MEGMRYLSLQRRIVLATLLVFLAPLLVLGITLYHQLHTTIRTNIEEQLRYRAKAQANALDLFLKEHSAFLSAMADTHKFEQMVDGGELGRILEIMNAQAGAFVELGVIDDRGRRVSDIGPYRTEEINNDQESWFAETMSRGLYISDVYMGFRRSPHFLIAVRRHEGGRSWILRATVDSEVFGGLVRSAHVGRTGDAFIVNREGIFQTAPRFAGKVLDRFAIAPKQFEKSITVLERKTEGGAQRLFAGAWLKNKKWLMVVSRGTEEEVSRLSATRDLSIVIIAGGMLTVLLATFLITRAIIGRLRRFDMQMDKLNAQLVQAEKLAALGKMAAGVAHEINNPLAVIHQKAGWLQDLLEEEAFEKKEHLEEFKDAIAKIEEHVDRARKVVHGMLGYAGKMAPRLEEVDINTTLNRTIDLLQSYARLDDIEIRTDFLPNLPIIAADRSQLQQVFLNLLTNAIDAIAQNGTIHVATESAQQRILVHIQDSGPGMTEEQQRRIFDPFYSTKPDGKGTGLGLWISRWIIEKMGGAITVESRIGEGATFTVRIPIMMPEKK